MNLGARIESISAIGELKIEFNATIDFVANISHVNSSIMDIYIIPTLDSEEVNDDIEEVSYNFTWNATDMDNEILTFELIFD